MKHQESNLQAACVQWFRMQYPQNVIFAIPNGGNRSAVTGAMMKREGARWAEEQRLNGNVRSKV